MPTITKDDLVYFENKLFLSMLKKILENDLELFSRLPFKLRRPYMLRVEKALKQVKSDLKQTESYMSRNKMRAVRWDKRGDDIEYAFISAGVEEHVTYTSDVLKNRTEELLNKYLSQ